MRPTSWLASTILGLLLAVPLSARAKPALPSVDLGVREVKALPVLPVSRTPEDWWVVAPN